MSQHGVEELVIEYASGPAVERADRWRRMLVLRLISLGITVVLLIVLYLWQRDRFNDHPVPFVLIYGFALLIGLGWAIGSWLAYRRASRAARAVPSGVAMRVGRSGLEFGGRRFGWTEVTAIRTANGRWPTGPVLQVDDSAGGGVAVPMEQLPILPATLDTTVRAYSAGRHGLDLSAVDA